LDHPSSRVFRLWDTFLAIAVMVGSFTLLNLGRMPYGADDFLAQRVSIKNVGLLGAFLCCWQMVFDLCGLYSRKREPIGKYALRIVLACTAAASLLLLFPFASNSGAFSHWVVFGFWIVTTAVEVTTRCGLRLVERHVQGRGDRARHTVIVGSGPRALRLSQELEAHGDGRWSILGFIDTPNPAVVPEAVRDRILTSRENLEQFLSTHPVEQVVIGLPVKSFYREIEQAIEVCERVGVEICYFPDVFSVARARHDLEVNGAVSAIRLKLVADDYRLAIKRSLDMVGAAAGLVALMPILVACAAAVKLSGPGPILFAQPRYGRNRRTFKMYKFRTMVQDAEALQSGLESANEASGPVFKIRADPRVTPVGRIMRRLSLDELPQLFNVLRGEMSLVGPRPLPVRDVSRFGESWLMRRFSVKPGLTCLWQIRGRNEVDFDQWIRLDLDYIDNWSLTLDMQILLKTVPVVLSGSGAS
jgi:exopolysaccharide biosynthesis polyprenyl glycosylphosphotransferase